MEGGNLKILTWGTCVDVSIGPSRPIVETAGDRQPLPSLVPSPTRTVLTTAVSSGVDCTVI